MLVNEKLQEVGLSFNSMVDFSKKCDYFFIDIKKDEDNFILKASKNERFRILLHHLWCKLDERKLHAWVQ